MKNGPQEKFDELTRSKIIMVRDSSISKLHYYPKHLLVDRIKNTWSVKEIIDGGYSSCDTIPTRRVCKIPPRLQPSAFCLYPNQVHDQFPPIQII